MYNVTYYDSLEVLVGPKMSKHHFIKPCMKKNTLLVAGLINMSHACVHKLQYAKVHLVLEQRA